MQVFLCFLESLLWINIHTVIMSLEYSSLSDYNSLVYYPGYYVLYINYWKDAKDFYPFVSMSFLNTLSFVLTVACHILITKKYYSIISCPTPTWHSFQCPALKLNWPLLNLTSLTLDNMVCAWPQHEKFILSDHLFNITIRFFWLSLLGIIYICVTFIPSLSCIRNLLNARKIVPYIYVFLLVENGCYKHISYQNT